MQIQINTDRNIEGSESLMAQVRGVIDSALSRISDHVTQVTVHLSDNNSDKKDGIDDIRCVMEAHLEGRQPMAVTDEAATWEQAVRGAAGKLVRMLETTLGRARHQADRRTDPPLSGSKLTE